MRVRICLALFLLIFASGAGRAAALPRFPAGAVWNQDISGAPVHPNSAGPTGMIQTLTGLGGFGNTRMQIDFSIVVVHAAAVEPVNRAIISIPSSDPNDAYYDTDCEPLGSLVPLPANAAIEGSNGTTTCTNAGVNAEDCHMLIVQGQQLFEVYRTNVTAAGIEAQCLAKWDLTYVYPPEGRGDHCTSADAAGFPISALLFSADDVFAATQQVNPADRHLGHAIRFILPNPRMARDFSLPGASQGKLYVRPGTHAGAPSGPVGSVPYGSRLRLRADFPMTNYNPAAQVILRTLQLYGMVLADGGTVALTAEDDRFNTHTWAELGLDPNNGGARVFDLTPGATKVLITDFAVLDTGPRIAETYDCVRTVVPTGILFKDGFE